MKPTELRSRLEGVQVIMLTPLTEDQELDEAGLRGNVQFLLNKGVNWFTPTGSNGEFPSLTLAEHRRVIEIVLEETRGHDVLVTPGCGGDSTRVVIELAKWCKDAGCSGVMIPPPTYFGADYETALAHYGAINDAVDIGIILYYFPDMHNFHLNTRQLIDLLRAIPNMVGIKDSALDLLQKERAIRVLGDEIAFIESGGEFFACYGYMVGSRAMISILANFWPELPMRMHDAGIKGDYSGVLKIMREVSDVRDFLLENQTTYLMKRAMGMMGLAGGPMRLPLLSEVDPEVEEELRGLLIKHGVL